LYLHLLLTNSRYIWKRIWASIYPINYWRRNSNGRFNKWRNFKWRQSKWRWSEWKHANWFTLSSIRLLRIWQQSITKFLLIDEENYL